ncbi:MAG: hypothetical protein SFX72_14095 [Isosphaeraceae bacterium]|nr:hypothetical protein [Isosphaeraceae bacterium]
MNDPAALAAKRLSWELESWKSIEIRSHEDFRNSRNHGPEQFSTYRCEYHYIETAAGERRYDERLMPDGKADALITQNYHDGTLSANLIRNEVDGIGGDQVTISRVFAQEDNGFTYRAQPLAQFYVGTEPLPKALAKSTYLGGDRRLGRDCERFLFTKVGTARTATDLVYWLDKATGVPLEVESFANEQDRNEHRVRSIWSAQSLDRIDGRHIPLRSELLVFDNSGKVDKTYKIVVDSVRFDQSYPKSTFRPLITKGATVYDTVRKKATFPNEPVDGSGMSSTSPIRAVEPGVSSLTASSLSILLGVCILSSGLVLWWRRRA